MGTHHHPEAELGVNDSIALPITVNRVCVCVCTLYIYTHTHQRSSSSLLDDRDMVLSPGLSCCNPSPKSKVL